MSSISPLSLSSLPLKALVAFDAAMTHRSFSLAAADLHVTAGAVGQQIQKLEEWLGTPLFVRSVRQVQPTAEALDYWASIGPALARLQQASAQLRLSQASEVWLSMPPTLAAKWFAPRMAGFVAACPQIALNLSATTALVDFERDRADLAIRYFDGLDDGLQAELLYADEARLYCAPNYARRLGLHSPADLRRTTLLHTTLQPHWSAWLSRHADLTEAEIARLPGVFFDQSLLAIETARHGQGVVLSSAILTEAELQAGSLIEPFPLRLPLAKGYYLVHPSQRPLRPAATALKHWLLGLAQAERVANAAGAQGLGNGQSPEGPQDAVPRG